MERRTTRGALALLSVLLLLAAGGGAATASEETPEAPAAEAAPAGFAGMRVVIDAETGKFRAPTAEELEKLRQGDWLFQSHGEGLEVEKKSDGSLTMRLGGRFLKASAATVKPEEEAEVTHDAVPVGAVATAPAQEAVEAPSSDESEDGEG